MADGGLAIGIDLGTTYCCVGIWRNGKVEIIPNGQGNRTTPSIVSFTDTDYLVGEPAEGQMLRNHKNTVFDAKRLIGRKFSDPIVQDEIKLWPFTVVDGIDGKPMITVQFKNEEKQFSAEDISSMILKSLWQMAEAYLGSKVKNAVITVPAYFNNAQRQATIDAGTSAGLTIMRVINEPTAAAIAYGLQENAAGRVGKKKILIFDLGGGTFDVSLMAMDVGELKVIATAGDSHLGGEDFNSRLVIYCAQEFERRHCKDMRSNPKALRRLRVQCEKAKRILAYQIEATIDIDSLYDGIDFQITISLAKFEELNMDLFMKCMVLVDQCIEDANVPKRDIEEVVLVGGSSRILKIQELLKNSFGSSKIRKNLNPDEAIACGAATQAAMLRRESSLRIRDVVLQDVTPLSLGLGIVGGLMSILIPKNTPIPVRKEKHFTTSFDNQTAITFTVFEGENTLAKDNNILGNFELSGLSPGPKLVLKIVVSFEINADGILIVKAQNPVTKRKSELTIARESGWPSREVVSGVGQRSREEDRRRAQCRENLENYAKDLRSLIRNNDMKLKSAEKEKMVGGIDSILAWLQSSRYASAWEYDNKRTELEKTWCTVVARSRTSAGLKNWTSYVCFRSTG